MRMKGKKSNDSEREPDSRLSTERDRPAGWTCVLIRKQK